ncbi:MAG: GntR family transcriptional regulator, partial [Treponema sp.]|nr:GntR family transcriptional regulator [Treponema sp.]
MKQTDVNKKKIVTNMKEKACNCLKDKILNCEYLPGQSISEKQIANLLKTGRTPVREALIMLQKEGLVDIFPRSDTRAKTITLEDTIQLYQLRKLIEPAAVIEYKNQIDSMKLLEYDKIFRDSCLDSGYESNIVFYKQDIAFHTFLIDSARNAWLSKIFGEIMQHTYRLGIFSTIQSHHNTKLETCKEHHDIIQSVLMEDVARIERAF